MFPYFHAPRARLAGRLLPFSLLLVVIAVAGAAGSAGAAPLTGPKPTRVPGLTPVTNCSANPGGDLDAHITDHPDHTTAVFANSSDECSYHIGLATYKKVDDNIDHQIFFAGQTAVIPPHSTMTLQVGNPSCAYQGDAFWGRMLTSLAGGVRYNERLLDDTDGVNSTYCTVEATATPTQQVTPPSATATAAAPTATATETAVPPSATATATDTAVPPSATATATAVPPTHTPTNTPTNTPTPGAQKIRPTNTPTAPPAGGPPAPTATATAVAVVAPPTATTVVAPPTATTIVVVGPPVAPPEATAVVVAPTNTPAPVVGGGMVPPAATATNTPVSTVAGIVNPPAPPSSAPSAGAQPPAPVAGSGKQGAGPVSRVGPLVGANNGAAPAELPPTGAPDLAWPLWLALAALALGSGLLLRRAAGRRTS